MFLGMQHSLSHRKYRKILIVLFLFMSLAESNCYKKIYSRTIICLLLSKYSLESHRSMENLGCRNCITCLGTFRTSTLQYRLGHRSNMPLAASQNTVDPPCGFIAVGGKILERNTFTFERKFA